MNLQNIDLPIMPFEGELSKLLAKTITCFVDLYLGIRVGMRVGLCLVLSTLASIYYCAI